MRAFGVNGWPEVRGMFLVQGPFRYLDADDEAMCESWERQHAKYGTLTRRVRNLVHREMYGLYRDGVEVECEEANERGDAA